MMKYRSGTLTGRLAEAMRKYGRESYDLKIKMMAARNGMRLRGDEMAPGD
jgi:hypothetical protein